MSEQSWNPWKVTAIGMALVMATALITGLVVANWYGPDVAKKTAATEPAAPTSKLAAVQTPTPAPAPHAARPTSPPAAASAPPAASAPATPSVPTQSAVNACNQQAAKEVNSRDKTLDTLKNAGVGAVAGAAVGAAAGAIAGGGSGAGKGAAIGGLVGAGGGTLYGLNENKKHDENYRNAYASCMRARGYAG